MKEYIALSYFADSTTESRIFKLFTDAEIFCEKQKQDPDFSFYKIFENNGDYISGVSATANQK